jgi:hypothetical protein
LEFVSIVFNSQSVSITFQTKKPAGGLPKKKRSHEIKALMRRAFRPAPFPYTEAPGRCIFDIGQQRKNLLACLRAGLLLLLAPKSGETDTGDLDDLETDTGNITLGLTLTTETGKEDLVVLVDEVETTVIGDYGRCWLAFVSKKGFVCSMVLGCRWFDSWISISEQ